MKGLCVLDVFMFGSVKNWYGAKFIVNSTSNFSILAGLAPNPNETIPSKQEQDGFIAEYSTSWSSLQRHNISIQVFFKNQTLAKGFIMVNENLSKVSVFKSNFKFPKLIFDQQQTSIIVSYQLKDQNGYDFSSNDLHGIVLVLYYISSVNLNKTTGDFVFHLIQGLGLSIFQQHTICLVTIRNQTKQIALHSMKFRSFDLLFSLWLLLSLWVLLCLGFGKNGKRSKQLVKDKRWKNFLKSILLPRNSRS
jgi:hypothetical protein